MRNLSLVLIGIVIGAAFAVSWIRIQSVEPGPAATVIKPQTVSEVTPPAVTGDPVGGPYELVDHTGATVTHESWGGKYTLVFFGFTHCPEICPTGLQKIGDAMELLGEDAAKIQPLLITVDPDRDTVDQIADYLEAFDSRITGLTGTQAQIDDVAKAYKVYAKKIEMGGDMYMMDHSAYIYLMTPDNTMAAMFRHETPAAEIAEKTRKILDAEKEGNAG